MPRREDLPLSRSQVIELLEARGILPTQQRLEIARVLFAAPRHLSADQVLAEVNRERHVVSKATVYNTLGLFAEKGLVREVIVDPARVFYDPNTDLHFHFYNVDTGVLHDIDPAEVNLGRLPDPPPGTVAEGVDVIIRVRNDVAG